MDQQGIRRHGGGFTRDISGQAAFILCSTPPPAETVVELEVLLPSSEAGTHLRLWAQGQVVRVQANGEASGFAVVGEFPYVQRGEGASQHYGGRLQ